MKITRAYLKTFYSMWAQIYDQYLESAFSFDRKAIIENLRLLPKSRVIEIGVGTGLNLPYYPAGSEIVGVDFSSAMLKKAQNKTSQAEVKLICADAEALPFPDNYFSHAIATYVIRVSPSPKRILSELSRVVEPQGIFVILDQFQKWNLLSPIKLLLGWGNDFTVESLLQGSSWQLIEQRSLPKKSHTRIVILKNGKKRA